LDAIQEQHHNYPLKILTLFMPLLLDF
jgi:hypothetical protein